MTSLEAAQQALTKAAEEQPDLAVRIALIQAHIEALSGSDVLLDRLKRADNLLPEDQARAQLEVATVLFQQRFPDAEETPLLALGDALAEAESRRQDPKKNHRDREARRNCLVIAAVRFFMIGSGQTATKKARVVAEELLGLSEGQAKRTEHQWSNRQSRQGGDVSRGLVDIEAEIRAQLDVIRLGVENGADPAVLIRQMNTFS